MHILLWAPFGAGSVVVKDIPDWTIAVGNPCRVVKELGERNSKYFGKKYS